VADILALYAAKVAPGHARPKATAQRISALLDFFGDKMLVDLNGDLCRAFIEQSFSPSVARHHLEDLRAAINFHRKEGLCSKIVEVFLPPGSQPRERWLTRKEVAKLIRTARNYREVQKGVPTDRRSRQHIARFILVALYTGTRAGAVCSAALEPTAGHGWIDLERGVFYRRAPNAKVTKKRAPTIPLPDRLLAHLRRWCAQGSTFAVEFDGRPVKRVSKAFKRVVADSGLGDDVVPHTLRHTAATWMMMAGTDLWEASGFLGMTPELLTQRYGHHHPQHMASARNAFARLRIVGGSVGAPGRLKT
jgi:integrase